MFQVRFHGRGGQGVVTAAKLLASAVVPAERTATIAIGHGERPPAPSTPGCAEQTATRSGGLPSPPTTSSTPGTTPTPRPQSGRSSRPRGGPARSTK
jgi:hypothetical protein